MEAAQRCREAWRPVLLTLALIVFPIAIATTILMMAITLPLMAVCMPVLAILEDDDCNCFEGCTAYELLCCCFACCFRTPDDCFQAMFAPCVFQWRYWVWCCNTTFGNDTCDDDC